MPTTAIVPYNQGAYQIGERILRDIAFFRNQPWLWLSRETFPRLDPDNPYRIPVRVLLRPKRKRKPRPRTVKPGRVIRTHKELAYVLHQRASIYADGVRQPCAFVRHWLYTVVVSWMEAGRLRYADNIPGALKPKRKPRKRASRGVWSYPNGTRLHGLDLEEAGDIEVRERGR